MKYVLFIAIAISIATSSCRTPSLPYTKSASDPYVQLKSGAKYSGTSAERSQGVFVRDKINLGDTSFRSKDVAFYSTGGYNYANVGRRAFAEQVGAGKINLYKYEYTTSSTTSNGAGLYTTSNQKHINYYIQKKDGAPITGLTYGNLAPLVQPRTPEYKILEQYRKTRIVSRSLGYGGLALLVGGGILAFSSNSDAGAGAGAIMMGAGVVSLCTYWGVLLHNQFRLLKTVIEADKIDRKGGHHKRVE